MKVLAVDDDPVFRQTFETVLRHHGLEDLHFAESGAEALRHFQANNQEFDCIFVDIQMPEMDGIELTGILRALDPERRAQIVMVTNMQSRQHIDNAFLAGADDFITKPLDGIEFKARLTSIQRTFGARVQASQIRAELQSAQSRQHCFDFEDATTLPDVRGMVSFPAFRNYLKATGQPRFAMSQRVGFTVENAANIFVRTNDEEYLDIMSDVAEAIIETLKAHNMLLTYAGCGDFICMTTSAIMTSQDQMESLINGVLEEFQSTYQNQCFPLVRVGKPARTSFFSRRTIDETIEEAISSARLRSFGAQSQLRRTV